MGNVKRREVESALCKKGFRKSNGDHRHFIYYTCNNKKTSVWTKISHGSSHRDLSQDILHRMAHQCQLPYRDFKKLINCPMSRQEYEEFLVQQGFVKE